MVLFGRRYLLLFRTHIRPGNRRIAWSHDGGATWQDEHEDDELWDGPPDVYGCKAGLVRLPDDDRDVLVFSSPGRRDKREDITVHVSFDGGGTWPNKRLVRKGPGNYTWMAAGRQGTPSENMIYPLAGKDWMARFNLAWIMEGHAEQVFVHEIEIYFDPPLEKKQALGPSKST